MSKIGTGFKIKPLVGSVEEDQQLIRYFPKIRFVQLLENEGLWFSRTYQWKDMDACEANLLPSYKRHIKNSLKNEAEVHYLKALMEFGLCADLGCCFSMYDSTEIDSMWRAYTPGPDYGVAIVIRASALENALKNVRGKFKGTLLSKVKYLSDAEANAMSVKNAIHSRTKRGDLEWDVSECHFYKRKAFKPEKEVRAVLCSKDSWTELFKRYIEENDISKVSVNTPTPKDQPYFRIDARNNMHFVIPTDYSVLLTVDQAKKMTRYVEDNAISHLESSSDGFGSGGYIPFNIHSIEKIILHPSIVSNDVEISFYHDLIKKHCLVSEISKSILYVDTW